MGFVSGFSLDLYNNVVLACIYACRSDSCFGVVLLNYHVVCNDAVFTLGPAFLVFLLEFFLLDDCGAKSWMFELNSLVGFT